MKSLNIRLEGHAKNLNTDLLVIHKDYALSYIIYGISNHPALKDCLIFKGGTALKKIHFGDYRFSEDLDYSAIDAPKGPLLESLLLEAIDIAKKILFQYGPFNITLKRKPEKKPHPRGQEAFHCSVIFPQYGDKPLCNIKIEITHDEPVILAPIYKPLIHAYDKEQLACLVASYDLDEIIAEKMRALLQTHQQLTGRGWNKPRARDYYDLWRLLKDYSHAINKYRILEILKPKCALRNVSYSKLEDFFTVELVNEAHKHWEATLQLQAKDLPSCQQVLDETKILLTELLSAS